MHENENITDQVDDTKCPSARLSIIVHGDAGAQVAHAWLDAFRPSPQSEHKAGDNASVTEG